MTTKSIKRTGRGHRSYHGWTYRIMLYTRQRRGRVTTPVNRAAMKRKSKSPATQPIDQEDP